ncbi:class A sortase [Lactobacillus nasalidis]|uniref:Class A sortase n=1 Tax=Lactobacillus nasalidis TaxID=2797258 RepID=A0ABQ3W5A0_9LACO|nr:class A sortase [Lactobacillus nasalidis]GHV97990.1 class A sortase [Lactobacillus nasalidis]GHV99225.1 class A sortase [Lactobacillus nasalidis]GHW00717.1 class A sortase [Lactobacillus nasalidis]
MTSKANKKKEKDHRARRILVRCFAVILFMLGLALVFNQQITAFLVKQNQNAALRGLTREQIVENQKKAGMYDFKKVKSIDFAQTTRSRIKNTAGAIGAIAIPSVKLYLPIMKGLSDAAMSTGGGTMRKDQKMGQGNYPLAGHYMTDQGALFSPLERVELGSKVYLTDLKKVYVYKIYYKKVVDPSAVWLVANTKKKIVTLITCADGGTNRWSLRGKLLKTMKASKQNLEMFKLR